MTRISKNLQVLDLAKQFISEGFAKIKKENPDYYREINNVMYRKNIPGYILKYFQRKRDQLHRDLAMQDVMEKTGMTKGQIQYLFKKGYTLSEILRMK